MTNPSSALEAAARFLGPEYSASNEYGCLSHNLFRMSDNDLLSALLLRAAAKGYQPMLVDTGDEWRCDFTALPDAEPADAETPLDAVLAAVQALEAA